MLSNDGSFNIPAAGGNEVEKEGNLLLPITPDPLTDSMLRQQLNKGSAASKVRSRAAAAKRKRNHLTPSAATEISLDKLREQVSTRPVSLLRPYKRPRLDPALNVMPVNMSAHLVDITSGGSKKKKALRPANRFDPFLGRDGGGFASVNGVTFCSRLQGIYHWTEEDSVISRYMNNPKYDPLFGDSNDYLDPADLASPLPQHGRSKSLYGSAGRSSHGSSDVEVCIYTSVPPPLISSSSPSAALTSLFTSLFCLLTMLVLVLVMNYVY